jgi:hypothetical protein
MRKIRPSHADDLVWLAIARSGGISITGAVIFDEGTLSKNIRTTRPTEQSPIDNTKDGIVNLGSVNAEIPGATGNYSTICGGLNCSSTGDFSFCSGVSNLASGDSATAQGNACIASGTNSHAIGSGCHATGSASHAEGFFTTAAGNNSHAEGNSTQAIGENSHAEGRVSIANADTSHAEGTATANGTTSHAEGDLCTANGSASHAEGFNTQANGIRSHAEGSASQAVGNISHAEGLFCVSNGGNSHAEGALCQTTGDASHAQGFGALALRFGQDAQSSAFFPATSAAGDIQTSVITLTGITPGSGAGESVELKFGVDGLEDFLLEDGKAYAIKATASAGGVIAAVRVSQMLVIQASARQDGGVVTIAGTDTLVNIGDAAANTWTLDITAGVGPNRLVFTFTTGATTAQTAIACRVEFTEIKF